MDNYLREPDKNSLFESNLYLAEDRIMANDIMFGGDNQKIDCSFDSKAELDYCHSWSEFLKQRKRGFVVGMLEKYTI